MTKFLRSVALAGLALCCLLPADAATVALYDGTGNMLKAGASKTVLTADGVSTLLSALLQTEASPAAPVASRQVHLNEFPTVFLLRALHVSPRARCSAS